MHDFVRFCPNFSDLSRIYPKLDRELDIRLELGLK